MQNYASKVSEGMALQLGCLELRYVLVPALGRTEGSGIWAVGRGVWRRGGSGRETWAQGGWLKALPARRRFYKDMPHNALEKKSNFEFLE